MSLLAFISCIPCMPIFIKINNEIGIVPQIINSFNEMWDICGQMILVVLVFACSYVK